eukprot:409679-Heterocapsa_arctica.AAC.1
MAEESHDLRVVQINTTLTAPIVDTLVLEVVRISTVAAMDVEAASGTGGDAATLRHVVEETSKAIEKLIVKAADSLYVLPGYNEQTMNLINSTTAILSSTVVNGMLAGIVPLVVQYSRDSTRSEGDIEAAGREAIVSAFDKGVQLGMMAQKSDKKLVIPSGYIARMKKLHLGAATGSFGSFIGTLCTEAI